jgi:AcrR family transcriptional regulator
MVPSVRRIDRYPIDQSIDVKGAVWYGDGMVTPLGVDPRPARHLARRAGIVDEAWRLAAEEGLSGVSMRALAARVGLRQPSLYAYFETKRDIYDAMYAEANDRLWARLRALALPRDPRRAVKAVAAEIVAFSTDNPVMALVMFARTVPGFEPSPAAYAAAMEWDDWVRAVLVRAGATTTRLQDGFVAIVAGVTSLQNANEPGGSRWRSQLGWMIDMYLRELDRQRGKERR